jgi:hypothetical protein
MVCAPAMLHPLWISPDALDELSPGQVIDEDPTTHFTMTFQGFEGTWAAIVEEGPFEQTTYLFDAASGLLAGYRGHRPSDDGEGTVQLQSLLVAQR